MKARLPRIAVVMLTLAAPAFGGRLEDIRSRFNEVQSAYDELKQYIDSGATDPAKSAVDKLMEKQANVCPYSQDVTDRIADIPSLQSTWKEVKYWCLELSTRSATLRSQLGSTNPSDQMSKVTEAFFKFGESLKAGYDEFREFGQNWAVICSDMCR
jgi:lipoprotein NlpI